MKRIPFTHLGREGTSKIEISRASWLAQARNLVLRGSGAENPLNSPSYSKIEVGLFHYTFNCGVNVVRAIASWRSYAIQAH